MEFAGETLEIIEIILSYWFSILIRHNSQERELYIQQAIDAISDEDLMLWEMKSYSIRVSRLDSGKIELLIKGYSKRLELMIGVLKIAIESASTRVEILQKVRIIDTSNSIFFIIPDKKSVL